MPRPVCILVCALGGEGGGVLAEWLYTAAVRAGHAAQATSIPGVAQRTGATTYYIEIAPEASAAGSPQPVFSLSPVPGHIDLLVSSAAAGWLYIVSAAAIRDLRPRRLARSGNARHG